MLHNFVLETSTQISMLFPGSCIIDCRIAVLSQPIFDIISLRVQEMKDSFDSILLREYFVMLLLFMQLVKIQILIALL